jgi:signal transduction histidine kinase
MFAAAQTDFYAAFLHEINQPLTTLRNILELTTYRDSNDWPAVVEASLNNVDRMVELLDLMGQLSHCERAPAPLAAVDIAELLREALEDVGASALAAGRQLTGTGMDSAVWVLAASESLRSALFRIVGDAVHHVREGETIGLMLQPHGGRVVCEIAYPPPALAQNENEALLALARTARGTRGGITRRVFRLAVCLRILVLQGIQLELSDGETGHWRLRLLLPAAPSIPAAPGF